MPVNVYSEIGTLKKVMIHCPGKEIDTMVPQMMYKLLFDDILYGDSARSEHQIFCNLLQRFNVVTIDTKQLLTDSIDNASEQDLTNLILRISHFESYSADVCQYLLSLSKETLASTLIEGKVNANPQTHEKSIYFITPIPNLMFARDPIIVVGDSVVTTSMAHESRQRESLLLRFIFCHHPEYQDTPLLMDFTPHLHPKGDLVQGVSPEIEGGDVLVLNPDTVLIGWSERTNSQAIETLANALHTQKKFKNLVMICLPDRRSVMHLDTVFTRINHNECIVYPPFFLENSSEHLPIIHFDLTKKAVTGLWNNSLLATLKKIGIDLKPIACGGESGIISQYREQWTDGANAFCIAPGIILLYERNHMTIEALSKNGYHVLDQSEVLKADFQPNWKQKQVILFEGKELSRARGGPRCLTHPLLREGL